MNTFIGKDHPQDSDQEFWEAHEDKLSHVTQYHNENHSTLKEE